MNCPLCCSTAAAYYTGRHGEYFDCPQCRGVFLSPDDHPSLADERARYETHNNDIHDPQYQAFVAPIVEAVVDTFTPVHTGLDFGCGTGPVISHLLGQKGYPVDLYDPFFHNAPHVLENRYDYIICCEVMEHLRQPAREFARLSNLLKPAGHLICMTTLLTDDVVFDTWTYKNDLTHLFFYRPQTIIYIEKNYNFRSSSIEPVIRFTKYSS
jgi:SAM-dependent methyltransferase